MKRLAFTLLIAVPLAATAQDFPKMRAGLWQTTTTTRSDDPAKNELTPRVTTICLDDSVQNKMMQFSQGMMRGLCSKHDLRVIGGTVTGDAVCDMMGSRIATKSVMKFSGDTSYHTEAHAVYDPPLFGKKSADTLVDGRYMGACPATMTPGDIELPGGKTINIKTITNGQ